MKFWEKILVSLGLAEQEHEYGEQSEEYSSRPFLKEKVVSLPGSKEMKVMVLKPAQFEEAEEIAGHLKQNKPVLLNVEDMSTEQAKRTIDFLSGASFALRGQSQKIGEHIFIFTPSYVSLDSNIKYGFDEQQILHDRLEN